MLTTTKYVHHNAKKPSTIFLVHVVCVCVCLFNFAVMFFATIFMHIQYMNKFTFMICKIEYAWCHVACIVLMHYILKYVCVNIWCVMCKILFCWYYMFWGFSEDVLFWFFLWRWSIIYAISLQTSQSFLLGWHALKCAAMLYEVNVKVKLTRNNTIKLTLITQNIKCMNKKTTRICKLCVLYDLFYNMIYFLCIKLNTHLKFVQQLCKTWT